MDSRTRTLFAILFAGIVAATALAAILLTEPGADPDVQSVTQEMTGVVVGIDGQGLTDVRGFTLRRPGGELVEFSLRALENPSHLPPGHLAEHQATAAPVRVWWRMDGAERLAIRVDDAPAAPSPSPSPLS